MFDIITHRMTHEISLTHCLIVLDTVGFPVCHMALMLRMNSHANRGI